MANIDMRERYKHDQIIHVEEAAELVGLTAERIRQKAKAGDIPAWKETLPDSGLERWCFPKNTLLAMLKKVVLDKPREEEWMTTQEAVSLVDGISPEQFRAYLSQHSSGSKKHPFVPCAATIHSSNRERSITVDAAPKAEIIAWLATFRGTQNTHRSKTGTHPFPGVGAISEDEYRRWLTYLNTLGVEHEEGVHRLLACAGHSIALTVQAEGDFLVLRAPKAVIEWYRTTAAYNAEAVETLVSRHFRQFTPAGQMWVDA